MRRCFNDITLYDFFEKLFPGGKSNEFIVEKVSVSSNALQDYNFICLERILNMNYSDKYNRWLQSEYVDAETKEELKNLSEKEIEDRFYCDLEFGTGGLRGVMAAGTNRMNIYTVRLATQGLANEILDCDGAKDKGVVIAFDSRNNSVLFANECAKVLCANGIKTYIFDSLRPTPELSFAVRHLDCARGIVITASHNPKEYNGYKVYAEDGAQIEPGTAKKIIGYIKSTDIFDDIQLNGKTKPIIIGEEIDIAYINSIREQSFGTAIPDDLKVVYTPLHGSGNLLVRRILNDIGVKNFFVVPEQEKPDGNFSTVKSPNPENSEAFTIAIEYAKEQGADIIFGTDPDSDRIGVVVRNSEGEYVVFNGNQTGTILCEYILRNMQINKTLTDNAIVVKTIVTTEMVKSVCEHFGVKLVDVLTGFKFIGEQIKLQEDKGCPENFVFGLEESYGYLKGSYARDKDAVLAAMLITEVAAECKCNGLTLYERLTELYDKYGYHLESLETRTLKGVDGRKQIDRIMNKFRTEKIPLAVEKIKDYSKGIDGLPKSDVLKFFLRNEGWFAVRPSGTEPKIKFYFGVKSDSKENSIHEMEQLKETVLSFCK